MEHRNIGAHPFNVGDEVVITGYDEFWDGNRFSVVAIKPHEDQKGFIIKMPEDEARRLWEKVGNADWWMAAIDGEGFDSIWWWEGYLTLTHPASLENE